MSALPYVHLVGDFAKVGMVLTLATNTFFIYITVYHIKNIKGAYKFLVLLLSVLGMIFAVMETIVHPFSHSFNASYVYFSAGDIFGASKELKTVMVLLYAVIYLLIICVLAIQFIYRYLVITDSKYILLFSRNNSVWWLLYLTTIISSWSYTVYLVLPDEYTIGYLKEEMEVQYNQSSEDIGGFYIVAYEGPLRSFRVNSLLSTLGLSIVLIAQYVIMTFCGYKIHCKIRETIRAKSNENCNIQSQLFKTLVLQITAPSLFYHVPAFVLFIITYLDITISFPSGIMVCFFSVYPAIDTLILMNVVTEYQRVIRKMLETKLNKALDWVKRMSLGTDGGHITATSRN